MQRFTIKFLLIILIISTFLSITSCKKKSQVKNLGSIEVNNYEGKDLSSIDDFKENSIKGPQKIKKELYSLKIKGLVNNKASFNYDEIINNYQKYKKVVTLDCVEGWSVTILWEGILVRDLLKKAGIKKEANTIIFRAKDGYSTSFPVEYIIDNKIMMAYKMNNVTLPPERGSPFQLVAEKKWGYKWIKWITEIELSSKKDYKGYWESRGYSNTGDREKDF